LSGVWLPWLTVVLAATLGAAFGSFLNVCIVRLPAGQSLVRPRSRCPQCGTTIAWYDNVPIVSWLVLRGRCRHCRAPISIQYPLIEAATAALWAGAVWHYGASWDAVAAAVFGTVLLGVAVTGVRHGVIPDAYTLSGLVLGLLLALRGGPAGVVAAALGVGVGVALLTVAAMVAGKGFPGGLVSSADIKLMAMVSAFVGWQGALPTIAGGALLRAMALAPVRLRAAGRLVPFGVFLAGSAAVVFVVVHNL
jgi:leader peptidase (prepilin peptidase)/N-methyltransferase